MLKGTGVSSGIGMAPVVLLVRQQIVIPDAPAADPAAEAEAFRRAHSQVVGETDQLMEKANASMGAEEAAIFEADRAHLRRHRGRGKRRRRHRGRHDLRH